jgi:hypothetical protein
VNLGYLFDLTQDAAIRLLEVAGVLTVLGETTDEPFTQAGDTRPFVFLQETDGTVTAIPK